MKTVKKSLEQLLGIEFMDTVKQGAVLLQGLEEAEADELAREEQDFLPDNLVDKMDMLLEMVGKQFIPELKHTLPGAPTESFRNATSMKASPVGGLGCFRLGEDGRLYLAAKSEHYHIPLGHSFPGYKLIEKAKALGLTNATHNNTRGYITRLLEMELVRIANGLQPGDEAGLEAVLNSQTSHVLNRVINLETGSLAVEAGIKMMLARFYPLDRTFPRPKYEGMTPVFMVMADMGGGGKANYHGTTIIAQTMRDMWPDVYTKMEESGIYKVCQVHINDLEDFKEKIELYNKPPYKTAGFLHEIIMMNYGGIKLTEDFLQQAYALCHKNDTPVLCDEIQSCMWYPGMFLFKQYGLKPDFVSAGKGFPGGQYAASRILTTSDMDKLNQFGALVTNGQEELAALAYLITIAFAEANSVHIQELGDYYEKRLRELAEHYPAVVERIEGKALLSSLLFHEEPQVIKFVEILNACCIDISAQTYKAMCPPSALTKLPLIATKKTVDYLVDRMEQALKKIQEGRRVII